VGIIVDRTINGEPFSKCDFY